MSSESPAKKNSVHSIAATQMTVADMKQSFPDTIYEIGINDPNFVVLVGDISHFALQPFAKACPGRFYNVGILEPTIISMAAGLAAVGLTPLAHTITPFLIERSFEQIKLDFCYQGLGGTLLSVGSAFDYTTLGCTHHCYDDVSLINGLPGTEIVYPASPRELNLLVKQTYSSPKLTYVRMARHPHGVHIPDEQIKFGKAIKIKDGSDVTVVATGPQLKQAVESVSLLQSYDIDPEILYYPTIKPFDVNLVTQSVAKTHRVLVVEEHVAHGGLADLVTRAVINLGNVRFAAINIPDRFLRGYGTYQDHCRALGFTAQNVAEQVRSIF